MEAVLERPTAEYDEEAFDELEQPATTATACQLGTLACDTCVNVGCPLLALRGESVDDQPTTWMDSEDIGDNFPTQSTRDMLFDDSIDIVVAQPALPTMSESSDDIPLEESAPQLEVLTNQPVSEIPSSKIENTVHPTSDRYSHEPVTTAAAEQTEAPTLAPAPEPAPITKKPEQVPEPPKAELLPVVEQQPISIEKAPEPQKAADMRQPVEAVAPAIEQPELPTITPTESVAQSDQSPQSRAPEPEPEPITPAQQQPTSDRKPEIATAPQVEMGPEQQPVQRPEQAVKAARVDVPAPPEAVTYNSEVAESDSVEHPELPTQQSQSELESVNPDSAIAEQRDEPIESDLPSGIMLDDIIIDDGVAAQQQQLPVEPVISEPIEQTAQLLEAEPIDSVVLGPKMADEAPMEPSTEDVIENFSLASNNAETETETEIVQLDEDIGFEERVERAYVGESELDSVEIARPEPDLDLDLEPELELASEAEQEPEESTVLVDQAPKDSFEIEPAKTSEPLSLESNTGPSPNHKQDELYNIVVDLTTLETDPVDALQPAEIFPADETQSTDSGRVLDDSAPKIPDSTEVEEQPRQEFSVEDILDPEQPFISTTTANVAQLLCRILGHRACTLA